MVRLGIIKMGAIATAILLEYLLDERAERNDMEVRVVTSGAKMGEDEASIAEHMKEFDPDLVIVASPNATLPGPKAAREALKGKPVIVVSDSPAKKIRNELKEEGFGYILIDADSMIGARREFLDPSEMALFNSDVIRVLSATGAIRAVQEELDRVIKDIKDGKKPQLPRIVVNAERAVKAAGFQNPYAKAKAMAAFFIAEKVAEVNVRGCFMEKEMDEYIPLVASAHEMMRTAAKLADEAREIEKRNDTVFRTPHSRDGSTLSKFKLMDKPH
jgi:methylenetetrahydromethanopterin dehydrogenase